MLYMYFVDFPHMYIYIFHTVYPKNQLGPSHQKRGLKICNYLAGFFLDLLVPLGFGDPNDS